MVVVDCPPPINTVVAPPLPQSPLLPPVNYMVAVVDCPPQTSPFAPPAPQPPVIYM
ncbi:uncharacterized protein G2W53_021576 [Senna tora]|uniref:Uncharacterized protein n=1 Tax=Senna tora TaxID=362788 RepID=A0A834WI03_9FABA|nr:uncharacterized protein G2W53_021576 [Senna tora]